MDDRYPLKNKNFHDKIFGKIYRDKDYLRKDLFDKLFVDGIHLITKVRKNMKKKAMDFIGIIIAYDILVRKSKKNSSTSK